MASATLETVFCKGKKGRLDIRPYHRASSGRFVPRLIFGLNPIVQ